MFESGAKIKDVEVRIVNDEGKDYVKAKNTKVYIYLYMLQVWICVTVDEFRCNYDSTSYVESSEHKHFAIRDFSDIEFSKIQRIRSVQDNLFPELVEEIYEADFLVVTKDNVHTSKTTNTDIKTLSKFNFGLRNVLNLESEDIPNLSSILAHKHPNQLLKMNFKDPDSNITSQNILNIFQHPISTLEVNFMALDSESFDTL